MKTKKVQRLSAETIAECLYGLAYNFYTKVDYDLQEQGVHRKTWCACVYEIMRTLKDEAYDEDNEFDRLAFLDGAGFFEVAKHESMEDWGVVTKREDFIDED